MRTLNSQDFALLSDHIYGDKNGKLQFDKNKENEITLNGITYAIETTPHENKTNGYFGAIYRRLDTNEIIVVHRGTEDKEDLKTDIDMARYHTNRQYADAKFLTEKAQAMAKEFGGALIYQTGHSLGGTLAQLCGNNYGMRTETYNAYSAANLKDLKPMLKKTSLKLSLIKIKCLKNSGCNIYYNCL